MWKQQAATRQVAQDQALALGGGLKQTFRRPGWPFIPWLSSNTATMKLFALGGKFELSELFNFQVAIKYITQVPNVIKLLVIIINILQTCHKSSTNEKIQHDM